MELAGKKINKITIDFTLFGDLDCLISLKLGDDNMIHIIGYNRYSKAVVKYKINRNDALNLNILEEEYD